MSARRTLVHLAAKTGTLVGAIFVLTVFLVAMPGHHAPSAQGEAAQNPAAPQQSKSMSGMDMGDEKSSERVAVQDMTPGHNDVHSHHMFMTSMREQTPADIQRAN